MSRRTKLYRVGIETLVGETLAEVVGLQDGSERVEFVTASGRRFAMYHIQYCCESVALNDFTGTVDVLLGSPVVRASEDSNSEEPKPSEYCESFTWTFYNISTAKGTVTMRWLGESNGYYGESVDFEEVK